MPLTLLLLQTANAILAGASAWVHFRNPHLWDDQAIVYSTLAGTLTASLAAVALGAAMLVSTEIRWKGILAHLLLTLAFASGQCYLLYAASQETGLYHLLNSKLG